MFQDGELFVLVGGNARKIKNIKSGWVSVSGSSRETEPVG